MATGEFWILALSGGGARGLFTAEILAQMEKAIEAPLAGHFDLIAGTSVGGILALGLAHGIPATTLRGLFDHSHRIFDRRCRFRWPILASRYGNEGLRSLLEQSFGKTIMGDLKHRVIIPAVNYTKGEPSFFKTPHHPDFRTDWEYRLVDIALATSAAPTYFPTHGFANKDFVDGGLVANAPGLVAVHEALHFASHPNVNTIHVVSVGTGGRGTARDPSMSPDVGAVLAGKRGLFPFTKGWGFRLFELTVRSQEAMSNHMLRHWLKDRHYLIDSEPQPEQTGYLGLDDISKEARAAVLGQAAIAGQKHLTTDLVSRIRTHTPAPPSFFHGPNKNVQEEE